MMKYSYVDSPVGPLLLAGDYGRLEVISFSSGSKTREPQAGWQRDDEPFVEVCRQLGEYFDGTRQRFDLALAPRASSFQARVLDALLTIPYGETRSYKDIAMALGDARAVRAVGSANGSNPLPIVIPCHRVIGSNGSLTGFGGGLDTKRFLLDLERSHSGLFGCAEALR
jgi:methylated-DNA-[protein]-cysteine S-methyltransferase